MTNNGIRLTNDDYDKLITDKTLIRIDDYINTNTKILHKCKICDNIFTIVPKTVLNGSKCKCQRKRIYKSRFSNEEYLKRIIETNYISLEEYKGANIKIKHQCKKCGDIKESKPSHIMNNIGCKSCDLIKSEKSYKEKILDRNLNVIEKYKGSKSKILHKCDICNNEWLARPNDISFGVGCPNCSSSKGEKVIGSYLKRMGIEYESEKVFKDLPSHRFDFYIEDLNIIVEFDGIQHFEPVEFFGGEESFEVIKKNDSIKNDYCEISNIKLIRISYKEFDIIENIIKRILI